MCWAGFCHAITTEVGLCKICISSCFHAYYEVAISPVIVMLKRFHPTTSYLEQSVCWAVSSRYFTGCIQNQTENIPVVVWHHVTNSVRLRHHFLVELSSIQISVIIIIIMVNNYRWQSRNFITEIDGIVERTVMCPGSEDERSASDWGRRQPAEPQPGL